MKDLVATVLAGGVGKRLWPLTTSKPLLGFLGKPLITHALTALSRAGIRQVLVVTNSQNDTAIRKIKVTDLKIKTVVQEKPSGMANALLASRQHISGKSILVVNASDVVEAELIKRVIRRSREGVDVIIPGLAHEGYFPGGYLKMDGERVIGIVEKPEEDKRPSGLVNIVIHFIRDADELLDAIGHETTPHDDAYERSLSRLLRLRVGVVIRYQGDFGFVKYPWDMLKMTQLLLSYGTTQRLSSAADIHPTSTINGPVVVESGVRVLEHATINGPAYIGSNSVIGTNALVIQSTIEGSTVVGYSSEVVRSYVGRGSWLHSNYIGDSVLEGKNYFGAGAVTANFRFDEGEIQSMVNGEWVNTRRKKLGAILGIGARVGVNASLMPGIKVGGGALIGPGVVEYSDVEGGSLVLVDARKHKRRGARKD